MKFRVLFISFNIVLLCSFITIFCIPFIISDGTFVRDFWMDNWYLGGLFLVVLLSVNGVFFVHRKTIGYIESQDWPALAHHLEREVLGKNRLTRRNAKLLSESLVLTGDFEGLNRLETHLATHKPALLERIGTKLASGYVLGRLYGRCESLCALLSSSKRSDQAWVSFYGALAQHLGGAKNGEAAAVFSRLAQESTDPLVCLLSSYLCVKTSCPEGAEAGFGRLRKKYTQKSWSGIVADGKTDLEAIVLGKLIDEASEILFPRG